MRSARHRRFQAHGPELCVKCAAPVAEHQRPHLVMAQVDDRRIAAVALDSVKYLKKK